MAEEPMEQAQASTSAAEEEEWHGVSLAILQAVKTAQNQHGLRHGDHKRYNGYCSRKLHRLYKAHKLTHGRGKYVRRRLEPADIRDGGQLLIPLMSAERAWSVAMLIKTELDKGGEARAHKHLHLVRRLGKASRHAAELARLAAQRGVARTAVEAGAYASFMAGVWLQEKRSDWPAALGHFLRCQRLCQELASTGPLEDQVLYRQQLEELDPLIRFCQYEQSRAGASKAASQAQQPPEQLQDQIEALTADSNGTDAQDSRAGSGTFLWRGRTFQVHSERARHSLAAAGEVHGNSQPELEKRIAAYNEAKGIIRNTLKASEGSSAEALEDVKALNMAVTGAGLEDSIRRGRLLAAQAEAKLAEAQQASDTSKGAMRPRDVVRQYDGLLGSTRELRSTAANLGGSAGELLLDFCTAVAAQWQALRGFFVSQAHLEAGNAQGAYALLSRVQARAAEAISAHEECADIDQAAVQRLQQLRSQAEAWQCVAQAEAAAAEAAQTHAAGKGIQDLSVSRESQQSTSEYLLDNLDSWKDFSQPPRLFAIPPKPTLIAMRPFLLDTAQGFIVPPSLEHRLSTKQKPGMVASLFGWRK